MKELLDVVAADGTVTTPGGYVGYKVGMILTYEDDDDRAGSNYKINK